MKRRMTAFLTALLLVLALCVPVMAETDYGLIYDETEMLGDLSYLGEEMLPELSEELGIDLRVDVFTDEGDEAVFAEVDVGAGFGFAFVAQAMGTTVLNAFWLQHCLLLLCR